MEPAVFRNVPLFSALGWKQKRQEKKNTDMEVKRVYLGKFNRDQSAGWSPRNGGE